MANQEVLDDQMIEKQYWTLLLKVEKAFRQMRYAHTVPVAAFLDMTKVLLNLTEHQGIINIIKRIRSHEEYTYNHSLNVAIIAGILGKWLGYGNEEKYRLVLSGLMHDIGKSAILLEVMNKPGDLTEEERKLIEQHTLRGYQLVKHIDIQESVKAVILQHHERIDGTGYPMGVKGERIHPHARVVAIADVYDAMTSDRVYHEKHSSLRVVQELAEEMFEKLDSSGCAVFLNNIQEYLLGHKVRLNTGEEAEVVYVKSSFLNKPIVRSETGEFIDLEQRRDIEIK